MDPLPTWDDTYFECMEGRGWKAEAARGRREDFKDLRADEQEAVADRRT